ncbi:Uncharacterised protein [Mycobacteroides abscessus subsp. bolletii]|uniref:hypothetical protein n=1 Tax=Mycobacteroides abscessus TaxID=36809 RepID=UPI0009A7968B|nr:hypothetical protein [Mycobacteroides abscessus]SLF32820.1 Uncharacterised protein [Mycobacteroides abscessus subsp. bolletii]
MSEPKNANEIITQAAIRWYGPAFTLGSAGFGGFILEELKAHGYAVVELPKPKYREPHGYGYSNENKHLSDWGVFACTEDGCVYDQNDSFSPEDAWTVGSWWLAASQCITEREVAAEVAADRDSEER